MHLKEVTYEIVNEFTSAIKCGAIDIMKQLLDEHDHSLINRVETKSRHPALYFSAIVINHELSYEIMKLLLQRGANPHFKDYIQQTVLFYVCSQGKRKCLNLLIEAGLNLQDEDVYGQTPIYYAAKENRLSIIHEMIKLGANVNHIDRIAQQTPLFYAAREGHFEMCKILVQFGCNVSQIDILNKTANFYAKKYGHKQICQYLMQQYVILKRENKIHSDRRQDFKSECHDLNKQTMRSHQNAQISIKNNFRLYVCDQRGNPCQITQTKYSQLLDEYPKLVEMLSHPDNIDLSHLQQIKEQESWRALASKMLSKCWKSKQAHYFQQPVDPSKYCISDYFDIVTQPMDLGTIKKKLFFNVYEDLEEFIYDMKLVFDNCVKYNGPQNLIAKYAIQIRQVFQSDMKKAGLTL